MKSKIKMTLLVCTHRMSVAKSREEKIFTDWFDFADFMKQENEQGHWVEIHEWHYIPNKPMTWK